MEQNKNETHVNLLRFWYYQCQRQIYVIFVLPLLWPAVFVAAKDNCLQTMKCYENIGNEYFCW